MRHLFVLLWTVLLPACTWVSAPGEATEPETVSFEVEDLYRHWVHSYEEDRGDTLVYRPADSGEFPPSRFRMQYAFREDGMVNWFWLAPNDAHQMREGTWQFDGDDPLVIHVQQDQERVSYRILNLKDDLLLLRRLTPP